MTDEQILEKLKEILAESFEISPERVVPEAALPNLDLDSIDAVDLAIKLQEMTGKRIKPEDFKTVRSVGDVVSTVSCFPPDGVAVAHQDDKYGIVIPKSSNSTLVYGSQSADELSDEKILAQSKKENCGGYKYTSGTVFKIALLLPFAAKENLTTPLMSHKVFHYPLLVKYF